ncbi:MAG: single-stranded-DNA-specific exonuclease RecJ [Anaerolineae bacterium]|nr:single-stranded-DNA-specific exonuclease RecJ [Anaerolineae bacterium]
MEKVRQRWIFPDSISVPLDVQSLVGGHPLVAQTIYRRGYTDTQSILGFLDAGKYSPAPATDLPGMTTAVKRIVQALDKHEKICIWGDFDVDGQTATTLLFSLLRDLGGDVVYHIPLRDTESHGIKVPYLAQELTDGVQLVVTCDTGIDAWDAVEYANQRDVDMIITDHHELPDAVPDATAVVNPHFLSPGHPLETLPGVGVAYKLAEALYASVGKEGKEEIFLDLVALGIVADVAEQRRDTRYLLQKGMALLRMTKRLGLQVLFEKANIKAGTLTTTDIGFSIAPRLNAVGRLGDANAVVELLTTDDLIRARTLAAQLESMNNKRRRMTDEVTKAAMSQIEREPELVEDAALVLSHPSWPPGVIGIVANRLADRYQRPVILLATPPGEPARGSARSVYGCHITEAIASQTALLDQFGGHSQAAGVTLDPGNIAAFRRGLSRAVLAQMGGKAIVPPLLIDGLISISELSLDFVRDIERLSPFGPGNPALNLVISNLRLVAQRKIGRDGRHLRVTVEDPGGERLDVIWWQWDNAPLPAESQSFDLAFNVEVNTYRGQNRMQAIWLAYRDIESREDTRVPPITEIEIVDYRKHRDKTLVLEEMGKIADVELWAEGPNTSGMGARHRLKLEPASALILWTRPANVEIFRYIIQQVSPQRLMLVADGTSDVDTTKSFIDYLTGLVKYRINQNRSIDIVELAAQTGHTSQTVKKGLAWLSSQGFITIQESDGSTLSLTLGGTRDIAKADSILEELKLLLGETAAYRSYFTRMDIGQMLEILDA